MDPTPGTTRVCVVAGLEPGEVDADLDRLFDVLHTRGVWEREAAAPDGDGWRPCAGRPYAVT